MKPPRSLLAGLLLFLALAVPSTPAGASPPTTRYLRITGTSTGIGVCSITIESFALRGGGPAVNSAQSTSNIPIPASSSPANSAVLIRDGLDTDLPAEYSVSLVSGEPNLVRIDRSIGSFTMGVVESVPTQLIETYDTPVPVLGAPVLVLLGLILASAAWFGLVRRQRV